MGAIPCVCGDGPQDYHCPVHGWMGDGPDPLTVALDGLRGSPIRCADNCGRPAVWWAGGRDGLPLRCLWNCRAHQRQGLNHA